MPKRDDLTPSPSAEAKNEWSYASIGQICINGVNRDQSRHLSLSGMYVCVYILYIFIYIYIYKGIRNDCRGFNNMAPRSSNATPCDFFLWGYVKDQVYVPPLPASVPELKVRIRTAIVTITADMLQTVWNELDYRVDVYRTTKCAHIEHL